MLGGDWTCEVEEGREYRWLRNEVEIKFNPEEDESGTKQQSMPDEALRTIDLTRWRPVIVLLSSSDVLCCALLCCAVLC